MSYLQQLAIAKGKKRSMRIVSLGQGQGPLADKHIREGSRDGDWVCLQNCHLAVSWLASLQKILEDKDRKMHEDYRLWLTSKPSKDFPVPILQMGIKITNEPPQGIRANMYRAYMDFEEDYYNSLKQGMKHLLYGLCFYNAVVLERRKVWSYRLE